MTQPDTVEIQPVKHEKPIDSAGCNIIAMPNLPNRVEPTRTDQQAKTTSNPHQTGRHYFKYAGRQWRLFKRSKKPDAFWYIEFQRKGEHPPRKLRSLETSSKAHAEAEAKSFIDAWLQHRRDERSGLAPKAKANACSTLGELFATVHRLDMVAQARGRDTYVWGARHFFQFALDLKSSAAVDDLSLSVVNGQTGAQFFTRALAHAGALATQQEQNKFKRQCRGWFNNTKALFAADAVRSMPGCGLSTPDAASIASFRASKPKRFKVPKTTGFVAPDQSVLRATFRQWIKLGRTPGYVVPGGSGNSRTMRELQPLNETARRNMFIAVGLMLACGLRKNEVRQIRWRHLTRDAHGVPRLVAHDVKVKKGDGMIEVKPLEPFWRILHKTIARNGWKSDCLDDFILAQRPQTIGHSARSPGLQFTHGGHSDRTYWPFYHIGKWLRAQGWNLQKTNHALRDCAASFVTMKFGLDRAKLFCRHSTRSTTEDNYSRFVREEAMDDARLLAWLKWAK